MTMTDSKATPDEGKVHQPFDAAALAGTALAGALAVFIEPGPYDWMSGVVGFTLLAIIIAFEWDRRRNHLQSLALASVVGMISLLIVGLILECGRGGRGGPKEICNLAGVCKNSDGECKSAEFESRVGNGELAIIWGFLTAAVFYRDKRVQDRRPRQETLATELRTTPDAPTGQREVSAAIPRSVGEQRVDASSAQPAPPAGG